MYSPFLCFLAWHVFPECRDQVNHFLFCNCSDLFLLWDTVCDNIMWRNRLQAVLIALPIKNQRLLCSWVNKYECIHTFPCSESFWAFCKKIIGDEFLKDANMQSSSEQELHICRIEDTFLFILSNTKYTYNYLVTKLKIYSNNLWTHMLYLQDTNNCSALVCWNLISSRQWSCDWVEVVGGCIEFNSSEWRLVPEVIWVSAWIHKSLSPLMWL